MVNDKEHRGFPRTKEQLILHNHSGGQHVMQATFTLGKTNHNEPNAEKHGREYLGKKPSCSATKTDPVTGFIYYFKMENSFPDRSLP
jgi:hypothetical protein